MQISKKKAHKSQIADGLGLLEIVPTATSIEPFICSKKVNENRIIRRRKNKWKETDFVLLAA